MRETDIAVIGGGPAGAWAACLLARRGARVTIFDASHPREKPCGGGITGRALALVSAAIAPDALARTTIRSARLRAIRYRGDARPASQSRDLLVDEAIVPLDADALSVASRAAFDAALLAAAERAGAFVERARVTDMSVDAEGVRIETTAGPRRTGFVIGADGANSLVRRRVTAPFGRDQLSIATGFFAHGVTSAEIVIELTADPPGYIWSFPRPDHLAIGICSGADAGITAAALRARTARWIGATEIARGARLEPYSWPIPSLGARDLARLDLAGSRWALVGDAAGLVDPITREGIYLALASAGWVADALATRDPARSYVRRVREEAVPELMRASRLNAGFFRPAFGALLVRALGQSAAIRRIMADLIAGRQSYATLKWQLIKTCEVGLAWRTLTG